MQYTRNELIPLLLVREEADFRGEILEESTEFHNDAESDGEDMDCNSDAESDGEDN